ncbi:MAG: DUF58 domain-containing protein [Bryobacteraceae bacterium]
MGAPLLDRKFLEKLERLTIRWEKSFSGLVGGHNSSRFAGGGQEFLDHRHFHHGDDLRAVNWRAYMRLEKLFLKMFQIEPRVPVRMMLDSSLSMAAPGPEKFEYARRLAAALCYVGLVRLDTIAIQPFAAGLGDRFLCGGGRHRFSPVMDYLTGLAPAGRSDYLESVRQFLSRYAQRGLLIVISDFLDEGDCERSLQYLTDFGHELLLIQVWSDEDRAPPWLGELELVDAESAERVRLQVDEAARAKYTASFDRYSAGLQQIALRNGGRYAGVPTTMPLEDLIFGPLMEARGIA